MGEREVFDEAAMVAGFDLDEEVAFVEEIDERFLAALEHGLRDCSGVALGFDRLVMTALELAGIDGTGSRTPPPSQTNIGWIRSSTPSRCSRINWREKSSRRMRRMRVAG